MATEITPADQPVPGYIHSAAYTGDIVTRLENWQSCHLAHTGELIEAAKDEILRLRKVMLKYASQLSRAQFENNELRGIKITPPEFELDE